MLTNDTPLGKEPDSLIVGAGKPLVVIVNEDEFPTGNVAALGLVKAGSPFTISVKVCVALGALFAGVVCDDVFIDDDD